MNALYARDIFNISKHVIVQSSTNFTLTLCYQKRVIFSKMMKMSNVQCAYIIIDFVHHILETKIYEHFPVNEIQLICVFSDLLVHSDHTQSKSLFNFSLNCGFRGKC